MNCKIIPRRGKCLKESLSNALAAGAWKNSVDQRYPSGFFILIAFINDIKLILRQLENAGWKLSINAQQYLSIHTSRTLVDGGAALGPLNPECSRGEKAVKFFLLKDLLEGL